jgi:hypothetical protein
MSRRIAALAFIFVCTGIAWVILGSTIFTRTYDPEFVSGGKAKVASNWGTAQMQAPPTAVWHKKITMTNTRRENGKTVIEDSVRLEPVALSLNSSNINVDFDLTHRQNGLLWYSTYKVDFGAVYTFVNDTGADQAVSFRLPFPAEKAIYDDLVFNVDGTPLKFATESGGIVGTAPVAAGKAATVNISYKSQGLDSWHYNFGQEVSQVKNFSLRMNTNFKDIDFPQNTMSPSEKKETADGWELSWNYKNLLSGYDIGMTMPEKLQPGPLAGKISFFAPVSLFFFFFLIFIITTLRNIDIHPMNYFFLACAFFAFHLLMAYTVDHISIHAAFLLSSVVSIFLVISYLRLVVGIRFAAIEAGIAQLVYLVLFSYAFFFKGFTGLAVTIGSIATLFVVMQMTGKVDWTEKFGKPAGSPSRIPVMPPPPPQVPPTPPQARM